MDVGEYFFEKISSWVAQRNERKSQEIKVCLSQCEKNLGLVIPYFLEDWAEIRPAKKAAVSGSTFYFPPEINIFNEIEMNRAIYLHSALILAGSKKAKINYPEYADTAFYKAFYLSQVLPQINFCIDQVFPSFIDFQIGLLNRFWMGQERQKSKFIISILENEFRENSSIRSEKREDDEKIREKYRQLFLTKGLNSHIKTNEEIPRYIWTIWGGLDKNQGGLSGNGQSNFSQNSRKNDPKAKQDSNHNITPSSDKEYVDLEKEKKRHNPVTHSFEKLETVDEYDGGYRTTDSSDQLQEHQAGLEEIDLKKVTRGGEASESFLKSDAGGGSFEQTQDLILNRSKDEIWYPEFNFKTRRNQEMHCRLFESRLNLPGEGLRFKDRIKTEHHSEIKQFQNLFEQLVNQKKWIDKQWEGPEVDIDSFTRYLTDLKAKSSASTGQFYLNQSKKLQDFELSIVIDNSLSTDSYVNNQRVINVALDAIGILGVLLERTRSRISVAVTNSESRLNCEYQIIKSVDDSWDAFYRQADHIIPKGYTRLGPALRHTITKLKKSKAQKKIILLLTDGKPTDIDGYEGKYGIEDMRQAALSACSHHIYIKAFAIEKEARHYFPHMFGKYEILNSPKLLPEALFRTFLEAIS